MTAKQSGQTLPLVALMLFCIVGVVAFVIDGSSIYSQQRRMQADLDMAVKVAADELPNTSAAQAHATNLLVQRGYTNPGITIPITPTTGPYAGRTGYAEGFLTQNVHSFFAGVLGLRSMKISVHTVAEQGGNTWKPPTLLALSPTGASNGGCGVVAQGGAGVSGKLDAIVHSNSQTCVKAGSIFATGKVDSDVATDPNNGNPITSTVNGSSGNGTGTFIPNPYDPTWNVPGTLSGPAIDGKKCNGSGPCTSSCGSRYPIASGDTYYQPDSTGVALISKTPNTAAGTGAIDFLPYCDPATGKPTFGIYLFNDDLQMSSTGSVVNVYDSTFVFNYSTGAKLWMTGGSLNMWGPCVLEGSSSNTSCWTSPFYGINGTTTSIAIWQANTPVPCDSGTPIAMENLGGGTGTITGIVDLPCANIKVGGNSANSAWISGALVAWDITIAGSGSGIVAQDPAVAPDLPRGSVLVQ